MKNKQTILDFERFKKQEGEDERIWRLRVAVEINGLIIRLGSAVDLNPTVINNLIKEYEKVFDNL